MLIDVVDVVIRREILVAGGSVVVQMLLSWLEPKVFLFFFSDTATTEIYTLSLHDALPIFPLLDERTELGSRAPLLSRRQRHRRQEPQLRDLRPELLFSKRILDAIGPVRFHEPAHFCGLVEVELLVQFDHPVAFRANAFPDLGHRLDDSRDARPRIEYRTAAARQRGRYASGARRRTTTSHGARTPGARQDDAVHPIHAITGGHRRCRALLQSHRLRLGLRYDSPGQA